MTTFNAEFGLVIQPIPVKPEQLQEQIENPSFAEDFTPQEADSDAGTDKRRDVEERAIQCQTCEAPVKGNGNGQREYQDQRHGHADVAQRYPYGVIETAVSREQLLVVLRTDPFRRTQNVIVGEGEVERSDDREDRDSKQPDEPRE